MASCRPCSGVTSSACSRPAPRRGPRSPASRPTRASSSNCPASPPPPDKPAPIHKPLVEKPNEPVFGDGRIEPFSKLERVELALPAVLRLHELNKDEEAKKLREQLKGKSAVRLELPAKNATRAFE